MGILVACQQAGVRARQQPRGPAGPAHGQILIGARFRLDSRLAIRPPPAACRGVSQLASVVGRLAGVKGSLSPGHCTRLHPVRATRARLRLAGGLVSRP